MNAEKSPGHQSDRGWSGAFTRPDLAIPCRVARQQSPTLFHQAKTVDPNLRQQSLVLSDQ